MERILSHVEEAEFLKEVARREATRLLEQAEVRDLADDPDAFVEALLAAILVALEAHARAMTKEARDYAVALGLKRLADEAVDAVLEESDDTFLALAIPALLLATEPARAQIEAMLAAGVAAETIENALKSEVTRKALFAGFAATLKGAAAGYISDLDRTVMTMALEESEDEEFTWLAVMDGGTCDDEFSNSCAPRHGEEMTLDEWKAEGLPGSPVLICSIYAKVGSNCRCQLSPSGKTQEKLLNPVNVSAAIAAGKERAAVRYR